MLKWPGRFGTGTLGGLGPAKPRHRGGLGPTKLGLQRIGPREAEPHSYSGAFPQRAFVEMTMADAEVKAVGFIKRTLPNGICPTGAARAGWQDLHDRNHQAR